MRILRELVELVYLWFENAYLRWQLRRHGVNPDTSPEIRALRRRRKTGEPIGSETQTPPDTASENAADP